MIAHRRPGRAASQATVDDAVGVLRANLLAALEGLRNPIVAITGAHAGAGSTSTAVALARSLAVAGTRVALVDLDLRTPAAHRLLGVPAGPGCADVLSGERTLAECLQVLAVPGAPAGAEQLQFLPAGTEASSPADLLSRPNVGDLLHRLADGADVVLLDTPAVLPTADALVIGRLATGAVLVVAARHTSAQAARRATSALIRNQTRILGVVLDQVRPSDDDAASALGHDVRIVRGLAP